MVRWIILGVVALGVAGAIGYQSLGSGEADAPLIPYQDAAAVEQGRKVYVAACAVCHGLKLEGQPNWRQRLPSGRLPAPPHDQTGHTWHHPDQHLFDVTKYGVAKFAPAGYESDMPGFEETLSDADILASLAYIKSTWPADVQRRHDGMNGANQ
jgi:mono/diheme cytochrome c family protein